jgi:hypothetical protein
MQILMVFAAEWHGELVAHLSSQGAGLRDLQVVRIAGAHLANEARLRGDKGKVRFTALADRLRKGCDQRTWCRRQLVLALL